MAVSQAQQEATQRYEAKVYDKILLRLKKSELSKAEIGAAASAQGMSVNGFIVQAVKAAMGKQ